MNGISIIITAWKTQDYIEDCLDSITNQTYFKNNNNFEILLGIDGCDLTLDKVKSISKKYNNLSIYYMIKNFGTYITSNTLLKESRYDYVLRFDSDDIMKNNMIEKLFLNLENNDVIQYRSEVLNNGKKRNYEDGSVFFKKNVFNKCGGYKEWECGADSELLHRINNFFNIKKINDFLYFKREHENALTSIYDNKSNKRLEYRKEIRNSSFSKVEDIKIIPIVGEYIKIE